MKTNLRSFKQTELEQLVNKHGEPPYRGRQLFDWLWKRGADSLDDMSNLPTGLREQLASDYSSALPVVVNEARSADGSIKLLLRLDDGALVETVLMPGKGYDSACVSTMVGCPIGCLFCATATIPQWRKLAAYEIAVQPLLLRRYSKENENGEPRLRNVVFMGQGEPLLNYEALREAIALLTGPLGLGERRLTVSTSGVVPGIFRLAKEKLKVKLAVSLNAPDDQRRVELMPGINRWPLKELLSACRKYYDATGQRITFEYVLIGGFNDSQTDAKQLTRLLHGVPHKLNLIVWNPIEGLPYQAPKPEVVQAFLDTARKGAYAATLRDSRGADIAAACGQLAAAAMPDDAPES